MGYTKVHQFPTKPTKAALKSIYSFFHNPSIDSKLELA